MQLFISHFKTEVSREGVQYYFFWDKKCGVTSKINEWDIESKQKNEWLIKVCTMVDISNE